MNKKKTGIIVALLVIIGGLGTLLIADVVSIPGLIQTGDYFENITYIELPNPSDNMYLGDVELEDYHSVKVADLYTQDTIIYSAGNIEFAYNLDDDNNFVDGYVTYSSDDTAGYVYPEDDGITEEQFQEATSGLPEIEEKSKEEIDAMTDSERQAYETETAKIEAMYDDALSEYGSSEAEEQTPFSSDDVIVDYYDSVDTFNQAISNAIGEPTTYQDLDRYKE